jgi:hypothetical protein
VNKRVSDALSAAVAPHLSEGERVEITSIAQVGQLSLAKSMATAAAVAVVTVGVLTVYRTPQKRFIVLTSQRLLLMEGNSVTGRPTGEVVLDLPRTALTVVSARQRLALLVIPTFVVGLAIAGNDKGLKLVFPMPARTDGRQIADSLSGGVPS